MNIKTQLKRKHKNCMLSLQKKRKCISIQGVIIQLKEAQWLNDEIFCDVESVFYFEVKKANLIGV